MTTQPVNVADGNRTVWRYAEETTFATDPGAVAYQDIPFATDNLTQNQPSVESDIVEDDARPRGQIFVGLNTTGDIITELVLEAFDDWWLALAKGTAWAAQTTPTSGSDLSSATSGGNTTYTRTVGSFVADGWVVNDIARVAGFPDAATNGIKKVVTVTATVLTVTGRLGTTNGAAAGRTIDRLSSSVDGTTFRSYAMEGEYVQYAAGTPYYRYGLGKLINAAALAVQPQGKVGLTWSLLGKSLVSKSTSGKSSATAKSTNRTVDVTSGVHLFMEGVAGGARSAKRLIAATVTPNAGWIPLEEAGTRGPFAVAQGQKRLTISAELFVTDVQGADIMLRAEQRTLSAMMIAFTDVHGNFFVIDVPKGTYTSASAPFLGKDQFGKIIVEFSGERSDESGNHLWKFARYTAP